MEREGIAAVLVNLWAKFIAAREMWQFNPDAHKTKKLNLAVIASLQENAASAQDGALDVQHLRKFKHL